MATIKHLNADFYNAGLTNDIPYMVGDYRYAQDIVRDFWYQQNEIGWAVRNIMNGEDKIIMYTDNSYGYYYYDLVVQNATNKIDILPIDAYCAYSVKVMDSFSATPPTVTSVDTLARIHSPALTALDLSALSIPPTWGSTNYLKIKYTETNGSSRNRIKKSGSYYYEKSPSYTITCDTSAATAYEIVIAKLTSADAGVTITIDREDCTRLANPFLFPCTLGGASYSDTNLFINCINFCAPAGSYAKASGIIKISGADRPIVGVYHGSSGTVDILYIDASYAFQVAAVTKGGASTNDIRINF